MFLTTTIFDTASESSSANVNIVSTPHDELSNPTQLRADTLAEGNLALKEE